MVKLFFSRGIRNLFFSRIWVYTYEDRDVYSHVTDVRGDLARAVLCLLIL